MTVGVFAALGEEVARVRECLGGVGTERAGLTFYVVSVGALQVVYVCGGVGKVNAALCTQLLISEFGARVLINTGIAGALDERLCVFDVLVSVDAVQHDVDVTAFGYQKGRIPRMDSVEWTANTALRYLVREAFDLCTRDPEWTEGACVLSGSGDPPSRVSRLVEGRVASGDLFVSDAQTRARIIREFGAHGVEMEGAAFAHVASVNGIPFVIIRCISDGAGAEQDVSMSYKEFSTRAARRSALLTLRVLERLSALRTSVVASLFPMVVV
ncbi:5'-methylthioadenosine/adenosylhomocysteine nucleosidase [Treponema paraluiscuniculi]|uniref:5'-methylthioadenosine/adenosylhomocysteine nucleosidase n=2 Tax=Treponema TaxID=157 RepID=UPI002FDC66B8